MSTAERVVTDGEVEELVVYGPVLHAVDQEAGAVGHGDLGVPEPGGVDDERDAGGAVKFWLLSAPQSLV